MDRNGFYIVTISTVKMFFLCNFKMWLVQIKWADLHSVTILYARIIGFFFAFRGLIFFFEWSQEKKNDCHYAKQWHIPTAILSERSIPRKNVYFHHLLYFHRVHTKILICIYASELITIISGFIRVQTVGRAGILWHIFPIRLQISIWIVGIQESYDNNGIKQLNFNFKWNKIIWKTCLNSYFDKKKTNSVRLKMWSK